MSLNEIAEITGTTYDTVKWTFQKYGIPRRSRTEALRLKRLKKLPPKVDIEVDPRSLDYTLGHLCGLILGDGYIYKRGRNKNYFITLVTTSETLKSVFIDLVDRLGFKVSIWTRRNRLSRKPVFYCTFSSKRLFSFIDKMKHDPKCLAEWLENNSNRMIGFLRGFYEAEGSLYLQRGRYLDLNISNTNVGLIEVVRKLLDKLGIPHRVYSYHYNSSLKKRGLLKGKPKRIHTIRIFGLAAKRFLDIVRPTIKNLDGNTHTSKS